METQTPELISIPYEAAEIRAAAKALGARWQPATKQWALPTAEAAVTIREQIAALEGSSPITVHRMHGAYGVSFSRGDVLREEGIWVTVERTERFFCNPDEGDCDSRFSKGFHWSLHCRPATEEESAEKAAGMSADELRLEAFQEGRQLAAKFESLPYEDEMTPPAEGSAEIIEQRCNSGFKESWIIEPEGTPGRRIIQVSYRGGDGDMWHDGNYGRPNHTGRALLWTAGMESVLLTAEPYWKNR